MDLPNGLRQAIEDLTNNKTSTLIKSAQELSSRYRTQSGGGTRLILSDSEAQAYCAARMPATYAAVAAALDNALMCFDITIESMLDVGAGTGAAMWAADSLLDLKSIVCIEREDVMICAGTELARQGSHAVQTAEWIKLDAANENILQKADIVISSYMLNEMTDEARENIINKLWHAAEKLLLIVEPGTPKNFVQMNKVRDTLLDKGAYIAAPCPHNGMCPISQASVLQDEKADWCHFVTRVPRSRTHRLLKDGDAPYEDEKFTYVAAAKKPIDNSYARILRRPVISSGYVKLELCTASGIKKITVSKKDGELFKQARKSKAGGIIDFEF